MSDEDDELYASIDVDAICAEHYRRNGERKTDVRCDCAHLATGEDLIFQIPYSQPTTKHPHGLIR